MASNFDNPYAAKVIGQWDFRDGYETNDTGLADGIAQDGTTVNGPFIGGGWLNLNGSDQRMDVNDGNDSAFDLTEGTIETEFRAFMASGDTETVVSRGTVDSESGDFFEISVNDDGSVNVYHADGGETVLLSTSAGFANHNEIIQVTYSWTEDGVIMRATNTETGDTETLSDDQDGMTFDITDPESQSFTIGAQESEDGSFGQNLSGAVDYVVLLDAPVLGQGDGIVEGTNGDDMIDLAYTGDPEGDVIDGGDAIDPGAGPDDDIVAGGAGDDTIIGSEGDDDIYAGSGSDSVEGNDGDDYIEGDGNVAGADTGGSIREALLWNEGTTQGDGVTLATGTDIEGGFTQDTGNVDVEFSTLVAPTFGASTFTSEAQQTGNIDTDGAPANGNSAFRSDLYSEGDSATYELGFSDPVANVSFRINDIDGDAQVQVRAYSATGEELNVNVGNGPGVTISDEDDAPGCETATSNGGYEDPIGSNFSILVTIPGPVARIEIEHTQTGPSGSEVMVTDVFYDVPLVDPTGGSDGNDTIDGGDGDDTIIANGGDDSIIGGDGNDSVDGGDDDDFIDTSGGGATPLPDRGFPGHGIIPAVPMDIDPNDDNDTVDGGAGNDVILTGDDDDVILGGSGDDTIDGGLDDDYIDGGDDNDLIVGGEGADDILGGLGDDTIYGGLDPIFPDALNIRDDGSDGDPDPETTNGRDSIDGGEGNDSILGQDDDDTIDGGIGNDTIDGGIDEDDISGGAGNDLLIGGHGVDTIDGGSGNDIVLGGTEGDELHGGDDRDLIGAGVDDTITGGEGGEDLDTLIALGLATVSYTGGDPASESGIVTFYNPDLTVRGTAEFSEIESVLVVGTETAVPAGPATISTDGPGALAVDGVVEGTAGDDLIDLTYVGDPEGDMIDSDDAIAPLVDEQDVVVAGDGDDTVMGLDDTDVIFGGEGNDSLEGNAGGDALDGGAGDDTLDGGAGRDILFGGEGADEISGGNDDPDDGGDLLFGGTGDDTFNNVGIDDVVVGGEDADGEDFDVLDLTGAGEAANPGGGYTEVTFDPGDAEAGIVTFFDVDGISTGTMEFSEIESVIPICFTPGSLIATPKGERRVEDLCGLVIVLSHATTAFRKSHGPTAALSVVANCGQQITCVRS